jgi:RNA polymerase sigma factor (TIGR02999 family)
MSAEISDVSRLLRAWGRGDLQAREDLVPLVYRELRRRAGAYLRRERPDHTLQPTALVHEAYVRLVGQDRVAWQNRAHFFGIASKMMRRILVDHAREHQAAKRPGAGVKVSLGDQVGAVPAPDCELLLLDQALTELADIDARQAQIVEFRYFGGLSEQEVAAVLSVSRATITRDWQAARVWLYRRMTQGKKQGVNVRATGKT